MCEYCEEGDNEWKVEDEAYVAAKRTFVEMESDDEGEDEQQGSRNPRKARKTVGWSEGPLDMRP